MQNHNNIISLFNHMEWADAEVWHSILGHQSAKNDLKIKKLTYHIHTVQRAFYYIWNNQPLEFPKDSDFQELLDLAKWGKEYYEQANAFLESFDENELYTILEIPWAGQLEKVIGRKPDNPTIEETMLQVTMHSAYHRGQVNRRLREVGDEPKLVDFIAWIWYSKPKANWDI